MGKKGFHRNSDRIQDDLLGGIRVINGRVQCVAVISGAPRIGVGPNRIKSGIASKREVLVLNGALQVVQG